MKTAFRLILSIGAMLLCITVMAQRPGLPSESEARQLLSERGISEEEFRLAMQERGYDLDNIEPDPETLQDLERVSMEVIDSLTAARSQEQARNTMDTVVVEKAEEIGKAVKESMDDGASPEEAIAEELQEERTDDLPEPEIFGHHLFRGKDAAVFRQAEEIKPPKTYVLGSGDELTVFVNGQSQLQATAEIDDRGYYKIATFPPVPLRGLTVKQAEDLLRNRLKQYMVFRDDQFALSVLAARTITVNFFGEVMTTGGITISAVNTLFNALVAAGGPSDIGSVRRIKLISGEEEKIFDVYEYMQNPKVAETFYLQNNDYVHIPVADRIVSISGAIKRPYRYELVGDEHLISLIDYAGGVTDDAYLKDIEITRFGEDQRVVINVNLRDLIESGGDYLLQPGDAVRIRTIDQAVENTVEIRGAVLKEGIYERKADMRVVDLIQMAVLDDKARLDFGYVLRAKPDGRYVYLRFNPQTALDNPESTENFVLQDQDIININSEAKYSDAVDFAVIGAVRLPGQYDFDPGGILKVEDALLISGGLKPSAANYGYIVRRSPDNPKRADYIPFNPRMALEDESSPDNLTLMPYDSLFIFDEADLRDEYLISVRGAVRNPDVYSYDSDMTLTQAIRLAGGLRFDAASNRIEIARVIINENQPTRTITITASIDANYNLINGDSAFVLMPFDQVYVRQVPDFELQRVVRLDGEVRYPGLYALTEKNERLAGIIERAGGLTPEAYAPGASLNRAMNDIGTVVIDLERAIGKPNSNFNMILMDGDVITIPRQQDLVTIQGAVNLRDYYPDELLEAGPRITVTHEGNRSARYYIDNYAAGIADDGRKRLITVEHPNGRIEKTRNFLFFKIYPKVPKGGIVNVGRVPPEPLPGEPAQKEEVDWGKVVADTLAQAVAIITLILLIDRID